MQERKNGGSTEITKLSTKKGEAITLHNSIPTVHC